MGVKNIVKAVPITALEIDDFTGAYEPINPNGLPNACFMIRIINGSDNDLVISYDGDTDNDVILAGDTIQIPAQSNSQPNNYTASFPAGLRVYAKGEAGTGFIYLAAYYQPIGG